MYFKLKRIIVQTCSEPAKCYSENIFIINELFRDHLKTLEMRPVREYSDFELICRITARFFSVIVQISRRQQCSQDFLKGDKKKF